jgi:tryptophan halogenase
MKPIEKILIVGGGTAGWLSAAFLAKTLGPAVQVTLVQSSEIDIIGVGEGSFPSLRGTLAAIGMSEAHFLTQCQATFKQGIRFEHWVRPAATPGADHYFHPFSQPSQRAGAPELLPYWLLGQAKTPARPRPGFADAVTMQKRIADAAHAPKRATDPDFQGPLNYAYHFDAGLLAATLTAHAKSLGVQQLIATVQGVELDDTGAIARVQTRELGALSADLYVDCSGFRALLIGQTLGSPWHGVQDTLFVDRAVAIQVPYADTNAPIASYTISTAHEAGWSWDIGLQQRRGLGYVYSSRYTDDARAEQVLRRHIGPAADTLNARRLDLKVGYRGLQWIRNCVAVGLSGGFVEPLEASGVGLIETAAYLIGFLFPFDGNMEPAARHFNALMTARYERIVDFVKMHYALTQRRDTPFWIDNANPNTWPDTLREKLAQWRCRPPHRLDFLSDLEMYPTSSWQYVLYGMEFPTDMGAAGAACTRGVQARQEFQAIEQVAGQALKDLPPHRALIEQLCGRAGVVRR